MLAWMLYVSVVSLLLGGAAFAAERSTQTRKAPTRWLWGASILGSLVLPIAMSSLSIQIPTLPGAAQPGLLPGPVPLARLTIGAVRPSAWLDTTIGPLASSSSLDAVLMWGWAAASCAMLLAIAFFAAQLYRRRRSWPRQVIAGTPVRVSEDVGPAVVGLLRPHIVVPRWIAEAPPETQALVMAHEQSHLDARDAQLLAAAIVLILIMPWNLPLWWQLQRLRFAMEVDCDARVLRGGHDLARYGEALIMVGERQSRRIAIVAAMSEPRSFLEQRIRKMLSKPKKFAWAGTTALAALAFVLAASAAEVSPPNAGPGSVAGSAAAPEFQVFKMRTYHNRPWGFSLEVPETWNEAPPDTKGNPAEVVRFLSPLQPSGERHVLIVFQGRYDPAAGVKGVLDGAEATLGKAGFAHFIRGDVQVGSRTVETLNFDQQINGKPWSSREFFYPDGDHVWVLGFGTTNAPRMYPLFDRIAQTFAQGSVEAISDAAVPATYHRGAAAVEIRVVDSAPDAKSKTDDQRVTGPDGGMLWLEPGAPITGAMFASAQASHDADGKPTVNFVLTPEGSTRFAALTRENVGRRLAILVNSNVVFAPVVRDEISGGKGQITGRFSPEETQALAEQIRSAAAAR